jgi:hypothetical protein
MTLFVMHNNAEDCLINIELIVLNTVRKIDEGMFEITRASLKVFFEIA